MAARSHSHFRLCSVLLIFKLQLKPTQNSESKAFYGDPRPSAKVRSSNRIASDSPFLRKNKPVLAYWSYLSVCTWPEIAPAEPPASKRTYFLPLVNGKCSLLLL